MALLSAIYADLLLILPVMVSASAAVFAVALITWLISLYLDRVSVANYSAPLMILAAVLAVAKSTDITNPVSAVLVAMVAIWALRLSLFLIARDRNQPEDRRYRMLRRHFSPHFTLKSSYIIFLPMAVGAWCLSWLFAIVITTSAATDGATAVRWSYLHSVASALWLAGLVIETVADKQLYDFNRQVVRQQYTLDQGLWRYCRHPNYFGEWIMWLAWFVFAIPAGSALIVLSPMIITWLLLKGTGIAVMEKDISQRRPDYAAYQRSTSAFFPASPSEAVNRGLYD
ncbi:MAG: DUF1295 domain-containing protein [Porticoccaceae bacterium]